MAVSGAGIQATPRPGITLTSHSPPCAAPCLVGIGPRASTTCWVLATPSSPLSGDSLPWDVCAETTDPGGDSGWFWDLLV